VENACGRDRLASSTEEDRARQFGQFGKGEGDGM
jgi:hypothetical protein